MNETRASFPIVSINVSRPETVSYAGKTVETAIFKIPVSHPVLLSATNFEGDGQADLKNHGGFDKAVCVYSHDHYAHWESVLGKPLSFGAFGENVTLSGALEDEIWIGDICKLGEATVQVSQPRQPCFKLSVRHQQPNMDLLVKETGFTGFYFRVLEPGVVAPKDRCERIERDPHSVSIRTANEIMHGMKPSKESLLRLMEVESLSESWKKQLKAKAAKMR